MILKRFLLGGSDGAPGGAEGINELSKSPDGPPDRLTPPPWASASPPTDLWPAGFRGAGGEPTPGGGPSRPVRAKENWLPLEHVSDLSIEMAGGGVS
jgi:hypothetical protein